MGGLIDVNVGDCVRLRGEGRTLWQVRKVEGNLVKVTRKDSAAIRVRYVPRTMVEFFDSDE